MTYLRIAHRGAAGYAPGNTLLAIEMALRMGAEVIEIDVQHTSDKQLVVLHDRYLQGATDGIGQACDLTLAEIRRLRTRQGGQAIPTLAEVLETVNGQAGLMIEMKSFGLAKHVMDTTQAAAFEGRLFYASFLHSELLSIRAREPAAATIALLEGIPVNPTAFVLDARATHAGLSIACLDSSFVSRLHSEGFKVFTYTADQPEEIAHAKACNVDGIISNYIDRL